MRIAVLILSLILMLCLGLQSCMVYGVSRMTSNTETAGGGAVGLLVAFLYLFGAAFVLRLPNVSVVCFAGAGLLGLLVGATTGFGDMSIWGGASLILAVMSFLGFMELRKQNMPTQTSMPPFSRIGQVDPSSNLSSASTELGKQNVPTQTPTTQSSRIGIVDASSNPSSASKVSQNRWSSIMTPQQWTIIGGLVALVIVVFCLLGLAVLTTLPSSQTQLATPRPTPTLAVLNMTIGEIESCCKDMTAIQEKQYLSSLVGSRVNWQGTVSDVKTDGTIWVTVSSTLIEMNGAPTDVAAKLSKGQFINFYAIITKAENSFLKPGVQLRFESLK